MSVDLVRRFRGNVSPNIQEGPDVQHLLGCCSGT